MSTGLPFFIIELHIAQHCVIVCLLSVITWYTFKQQVPLIFGWMSYLNCNFCFISNCVCMQYLPWPWWCSAASLTLPPWCSQWYQILRSVCHEAVWVAFKIMFRDRYHSLLQCMLHSFMHRLGVHYGWYCNPTVTNGRPLCPSFAYCSLFTCAATMDCVVSRGGM